MPRRKVGGRGAGARDACELAEEGERGGGADPGGLPRCCLGPHGVLTGLQLRPPLARAVLLRSGPANLRATFRRGGAPGHAPGGGLVLLTRPGVPGAGLRTLPAPARPRRSRPAARLPYPHRHGPGRPPRVLLRGVLRDRRPFAVARGPEPGGGRRPLPPRGGRE